MLAKTPRDIAQVKLDSDYQKLVVDSQTFHEWLRLLAEEKKATPMQRLIALRLGLFRNKDDGRCFPSYKTLSDAVGADRSTVIRAVKALVDLGWIAEPGSRGRRSNNFVLTFPNSGASATVETSKESVNTDSNSGSGATVDGSTVALVPPQQSHQRHRNSGASATLMSKEGLTEVGAAPAAPHIPIERDIEERFSKLLQIYPPSKLGDENEARTAYELSLKAGAYPDEINDKVKGSLDWLGDDMPVLATAIAEARQEILDGCPF